MPRASLLPLALLVLTACASPAAPTDAGTDAMRADSAACVADPSTFPTPEPGACTPTVLEGAELPAGEIDDEHFVVPGGERLLRVGRNVRVGGFPMRMIAVPGTRLVVVSDGGLRDETLAVIDVDTLEIVDQRQYVRGLDQALFLGLAISDDGRRLWASGGGQNVVHALDLDPATGQLTDAPERAISITTSMPREGYVTGLALSGDRLAFALMADAELVIHDVATDTELRRVALPEGSRPYDVVIEPGGARAWVSLWAARSVVSVDLETGTILSTIEVGKNPEGLALSADGSLLAVACADSDSVVLIDTALRTAVETFFADGEDAPRGYAPAALRFGPDERLYVVHALDDAIDVLERGMGTLRRVGRIPTLWHPTDVLPLSDGTIAFINGRHLGTGANTSPGDTDITSLMGGSLSVLGPTEHDDAQLAAWDLEVGARRTRMAESVGVSCPDGADYDFPIPRPGEGPSRVIEHVVIIIRENKTYDAYLGDLTDDEGAPLGNGDPALTLLPHEEMDMVLPNTRELARRFAFSDNYYSHAEQSVQGHVWTTMGRTTDYVERTWLSTWGRGYLIPSQGLSDEGLPEEGSAFDYLVRNDIDLENYGEIVSSRAITPNGRYPGIVYSYIPDTDKAEWWSGRVAACDLSTVTYALFPNDHTRGLDPGARTPRAMIADNDFAVGRIVDAISHSTFWPSTVIFVIEDDPQDGGDHVDNHRSPLQVISPWARRGHVSHVHTSEASMWRTIQLILGIAERHSAEWEQAAPLYDLFTSTPDYTPYEVLERRWPEETNPDDGSRAAALSASYDWSRPDEQPGLSRLLWEHFHGEAAPWPVWQELPGADDEDEEVDESP